jgi:hypothetical protein
MRPQGGPAFNETFEFTDIIDQPCFGAPICLLPDAIDVKLKAGSFINFNGSLDGDISEEGASLTISEGVSGKFVLEVTANGDLDLPPIPIPGASIGFSAEIDDTGIGAEAVLGIVVRIRVTFNEPGTIFITTIEFSESASIGLVANIDGVDFTTSGSIDGDIGFDLVDTRGGCIRISIGPELSLFAGVDFKVCEVGVGAGANVSPFIEGCLNVDLQGCPSYDAEIALGLGGFVEAGADFCVFEVGDDLEFELARLPLFGFSGLIPETEPPVITGQSSFNAVTAAGCPPRASTLVNYPLPLVTDNCPDPTIACIPAPGSSFPIGTTTVNCTATDIWGNTATFSFPLTVFNGCLQDDSNPGNAAVFNSATGEYRICMNGTTYSGVGIAAVKGCVVTIQHNTPERRVLIKADFATRRGTASLQSGAGVLKGTIADRDLSNNSCSCTATQQNP